MDRLVKKLQLLLAILLGAFVIASCAADDGQETAVELPAEPMKPAASQVAPMIENQAPGSIPENIAAPSEVPATVPAAEDDLAPTAAATLAPLPVIGPAPSWENDTWINTDAPLPLEDLRGKVVLLEFWTFG